MKDQFKHALAPDGLLSRFLYLILFAVIFYLCIFLVAALVIFQFMHLVLTGERNEKGTDFAVDFSAYLGQVGAYLTLASENRPFPFRDWKDEPATASDATAPAEPEKTARPKVKPRKKAASNKTAT